MARTKQEIDPNETASDRFIRIAEPRVSNALDAIERIGKLANPGMYDYDPETVAEILSVLRKMVDKVEANFTAPGTPKRNIFRLASAVKTNESSTPPATSRSGVSGAKK
jgi:hypothetical protein